jgi:hypothetical protein
MGTYTEIGIDQIYYGDSNPDVYKNVLLNTASFRQVQKALLEATRKAIEQAKSCQTETQKAIMKAMKDSGLDLDKDTVRKNLQLALPSLPGGKQGPEVLTEKGRGHLLKFLLTRIRAVDTSGKPSEKTISNWLRLGQRPGEDRDIFKICFALDLRKREDVEALFIGMNGEGDGGSRPLHRRDAETIAYWECLASGKSWEDACEILNKYKAWIEDNSKEGEPSDTKSKPRYEYTNVFADEDASLLDDEARNLDQILEDLIASREVFESHSATLRDAYLKQKADYVVRACIFHRAEDTVKKDVRNWANNHKDELKSAGFGACYRNPNKKNALTYLKAYHKLLNKRFNSDEPFEEEHWKEYLEKNGQDFDSNTWIETLEEKYNGDAEICEMGWAEICRIHDQLSFKNTYEYLAFMIKNSTLVELAFSETRKITGVRVGRADVPNKGPRPAKNYHKELSDYHLTSNPFFEGYPCDQYLNQIDGTSDITRPLRSYQTRKAILLLFFFNYSLKWELGEEPEKGDSYGLNDFVKKLNGKDLEGYGDSQGVLNRYGFAHLKSSNQCDQLLMESIWQYEAGGTRKHFEDYKFRDPSNPSGERIPSEKYLSEDPDDLEEKLEAVIEARKATEAQEELDDYAYNIAALKQMLNYDPVTPSEYFDLVFGGLLLEESSD